MTMVTLTAIPTPPQCSFNQTAMDTSSSTLKELTAAKLSVHNTDTTSFHSSPVLHNIPTRILPPSAATNVINLPVDNDEQHPNQTKCIDPALYYTFMKEWDDFYKEFVTSQTHALVHSSATSFLSFPVDDDDDN